MRELLVLLVRLGWYLFIVEVDFVIKELNVLNLLLEFKLFLGWGVWVLKFLNVLKFLKFWLRFFLVVWELLVMLEVIFKFWIFFVDLKLLKLFFLEDLIWLDILKFLKFVNLLLVVWFFVVVGFEVLNRDLFELKLSVLKVLYLFLEVLIWLDGWEVLFWNVEKFVNVFFWFLFDECVLVVKFVFEFFLFLMFIGLMFFLDDYLLESLNIFNDEVGFLEVLELKFENFLVIEERGLGLCWKLLKSLVLVKFLLLIFLFNLVWVLFIVLVNKLRLVILEFSVLLFDLLFIMKLLNFWRGFIWFLVWFLLFVVEVLFLFLGFFFFWKLLKLSICGNILLIWGSLKGGLVLLF